MLPTKCFMMDKVFSRVVNFTLNSMAYLNQFSLALSGHPGSGTAFYVEKPVQRMMYSFVPDLSWLHTHTQSSNTYLRHQSRLKKALNIKRYTSAALIIKELLQSHQDIDQVKRSILREIVSFQVMSKYEYVG
ncbi:hypothetical protein Tco_0748005 [Tanacetum coccineum]|uniref:Uncharacterized protein n=1 Tax=Tanacetum coccineum TaxID=301880 RepID=A0ABQ4YUG8_9ASTR